MAYYNNIAEDNFKKEAIKRGYKIKKSDSQSDMYKHIDFYMSSEDSPPFSVDVKGRKKAARKSNSYDDVYTWVEFDNVRGNKGWLYGEADYIVFEQVNKYIFIDRENLLKYCLDSVEDDYVNSSSQAIYKKYQRFGRKDVISRIKLSDAIESKHFTKPPLIWEKAND